MTKPMPNLQDSFRPFNKSNPQKKSQKENSTVTRRAKPSSRRAFIHLNISLYVDPRNDRTKEIICDIYWNPPSKIC